MFIKVSNELKRTGRIITKNGEIHTPFFMPDATRGFVRSIDNGILDQIGLEIILINTYHLFLNPGMEIMKKAGDAHNMDQILWQFSVCLVPLLYVGVLWGTLGYLG